MYCMNLSFYSQFMAYLLANIMDISTLLLSPVLACSSSILYTFLALVPTIFICSRLAFSTGFAAYVNSILLVSSPSPLVSCCSVRLFALSHQNIHTSPFSFSCFTQPFCHSQSPSRSSLLRFYLFSFQLIPQFLAYTDCYLFTHLSVSLFVYSALYSLMLSPIDLYPVPLSQNQCIQIHRNKELISEYS